MSRGWELLPFEGDLRALQTWGRWPEAMMRLGTYPLCGEKRGRGVPATLSE